MPKSFVDRVGDRPPPGSQRESMSFKAPISRLRIRSLSGGSVGKYSSKTERLLGVSPILAAVRTILRSVSLS